MQLWYRRAFHDVQPLWQHQRVKVPRIGSGDEHVLGMIPLPPAVLPLWALWTQACPGLSGSVSRPDRLFLIRILDVCIFIQTTSLNIQTISSGNKEFRLQHPDEEHLGTL